jgi:hypothetical protein
MNTSYCHDRIVCTKIDHQIKELSPQTTSVVADACVYRIPHQLPRASSLGVLLSQPHTRTEAMNGLSRPPPLPYDTSALDQLARRLNHRPEDPWHDSPRNFFVQHWTRNPPDLRQNFLITSSHIVSPSSNGSKRQGYLLWRAFKQTSIVCHFCVIAHACSANTHILPCSS